MTYEEAIAKAGKLLRLATSSNPNEAALAAARAQEIIDRYKLGNVTLNYEEQHQAPDEPIKDFADDPLNAGNGIVQRWAWSLFLAIAKGNQCKGYAAVNRGGIAIVGRPSDVATVRYFYNYLKREVDRLTAQNSVGYGRSWCNNFRLGVVDTIRVKLQEQYKATVAAVKQEATLAIGDATLALVRVNNAIAIMEKREQEVEDWVETNLKLTSGSRSRSSYDPTARARGREAGQSIRITSARGALGSGVKQIG